MSVPYSCCSRRSSASRCVSALRSPAGPRPETLSPATASSSSPGSTPARAAEEPFATEATTLASWALKLTPKPPWASSRLSVATKLRRGSAAPPMMPRGGDRVRLAARAGGGGGRSSPSSAEQSLSERGLRGEGGGEREAARRRLMRGGGGGGLSSSPPFARRAACRAILGALQRHSTFLEPPATHQTFGRRESILAVWLAAASRPAGAPYSRGGLRRAAVVG